MRHRLYCVNGMEFWCSDESAVIDNCSDQYDVFMFDADEHTACCSAQLTYAMDPLYGAFKLKCEEERDPSHYGQADEEIVDAVKAEIEKYLREDVLYIRCSQVDDLPHFKRGELPKELPNEFVIIWDDGPFEDPDYETMDSFMSDVEGDYPL